MLWQNGISHTLILLSYVDLPRLVDIENVKVNVTFLENVSGLFTENCVLELFDKIIQTEQFFDGLLLFCTSCMSWHNTL